MNPWNEIKKMTGVEYEAFYAALQKPAQTQQKILQEIISSNAQTIFGKKHNFSSIQNYEDFQKHMPIRSYEDFAPYIERIAQGEDAVLTQAPVIHLEETGGSTSGPKLIPYTQETLKAFQRAVLPWLYDLLLKRPKICDGKVFFLISPATGSNKRAQGAIPIGTGDDVLYFGESLAPFLAQVVVDSTPLSSAENTKEWLSALVSLLKDSTDLRFVSIWSPTLLLEAFPKSEPLPDLSHIDTISCWDSHTARPHAQTLREMLPGIFIQGKGLLATEGITTIPFGNAPHPVLAINSHFYEFMDEEDNAHLFDGLRDGQSYRVVLTTQSGLYRYDTGDLVMKKSEWKNVPIFEFTGRGNLVSDLCGEKLTESFVRNCLEEIDERLLGQCILRAVDEEERYYKLLIDTELRELLSFSILGEALDKKLSQNPQYAHARKIGQLNSITILPVKNLVAYFHENLAKNAQRQSVIKLPALQL